MKRLYSLPALTITANIITWLFIYLKIRPGSEIIPLHYSIFSGADWVGKGFYIYLLPFAGLIIFLVNLFLSRRFEKIDKFSGQILTAASFTAQIIILIAVLYLKSLIQI